MGKRQYRRSKVNGYEFILKHAEWLESPAYRALNPLARCLLEEFLIIYRENRNGRLSISTKQAMKRLAVSKNVVKAPFYELVEHGFLVLVKGHLWRARLAREWRLTMMPSDGKEPTDDWRRWQPGQPVRATPLGKKKSRSQQSEQTGSETEAALAEKLGQDAGQPKAGVLH